MHYDSLPPTPEDQRLEFVGYHGYPAACRIRVYRPERRGTIIVATEIPDNPGTQISNLSEHIFYLAWLAAGQPDPVIFLEHYPERQVRRFYDVQDCETFDTVTFPLTRSGKIAVQESIPSVERRFRHPELTPSWHRTQPKDQAFGAPAWKRLTYREVETLLRVRLLPNPNRYLTEYVNAPMPAVQGHAQKAFDRAA
jgi:hypothetical protein